MNLICQANNFELNHANVGKMLPIGKFYLLLWGIKRSILGSINFDKNATLVIIYFIIPHLQSK